MHYTPKHSPAPKRTLRRKAGVTLAGAATVAAGLGFSAPAAHASNVWDRVAACESSGDWSINTGNPFSGGLQFLPSTWNGFGGQKYAPMAYQATKAQQIEIAQNVLRVQGPGAWPVCSVRAGLTLENGLASGATGEGRNTGGAGAPAAPAPAAPAPQQAPQPQAAPQAPAQGFDYTVRSGDTVYQLAQRYGTTTGAIVSNNGLPNGGWLIMPGQHLVIPGTAPAQQSTSTYTVQAGDALWNIARDNGVSVGDIVEANDLSNPDLILIGQSLEIPSS